MKIRSIPHLISQGFISFFRNGAMTTASIAVLIFCMILPGTFFLLIDNIDRFLEGIDDLYVINAYVMNGAGEEDIRGIEEQISKIEHVSAYTQVTSDEALEELKERAPSIKEILNRYDAETNPLPHTFKVEFSDFDEVHSIIRDLNAITGIDEVKSQISVYEGANRLKSLFRVIGIWIMVILFVVAILVIMNTVKLTVYSRRQEIAIMRYIGATSAFVIAPFIVEGVIIGIVSAVVALGLQFCLYEITIDMVGTYGGTAILGSFVNDYLVIIALAFLAIGIFSGVVASSICVKKHLNV